MTATILIIDDDELFSNTVSFVLEQSEHEVLTASSGVEGLELARQHRPDLVLCDVHMRNGHGYATAQALRERPETMGVPIVMMTGNASPFGESRSRISGADYYLAKPFSVDELMDVVRQALTAKQSEAQRSHHVIFPSGPSRVS